MNKHGERRFLRLLRDEVEEFKSAVSTQNGDWIVKGFIDIARNVYTISIDTKVISKVIEILLFPRLSSFAERNSLSIRLPEHQNFYPDISFVDSSGCYFALDIKSTYRIDDRYVNGMTLGTFTGYFRDRKSTKNITRPYNSYKGHFVLGVIYTKIDKLYEQRIYSLNELEYIKSVIGNFSFFIHEKYRIASDRPGSGNTRNIGSVTEVDKLVNGSGPFAALGEEVFDDYWTYYLTRDMARAAELTNPPYTDLPSYLEYKKLKK
ncbi:EcoRV family type II restriction endonuclease [Chloracidobacterium sp. E]|nr:EcoRV family type II restriction endonuclease [Chloracidobacterium sp. 2]QUV89746.1 EcoRV family type II restriction endonuclease [Chloracidobacterium sp. S]QUV98898.1 EcoRV family type II restriction endonuclease [Chloracidobacterium sp. E]